MPRQHDDGSTKRSLLDRPRRSGPQQFIHDQSNGKGRGWWLGCLAPRRLLPRTTSIGGKKHAMYTMTLSLRSAAAGPVTLTRYEARASLAGLAETEWSGSVEWSLQHASEFKVPFQLALPCSVGSGPCEPPMGPTWTILLLGSDRRGRPIREVIALTLPPAPGKPVTPPTKISRASTPATGVPGSAIEVRISHN